MRRLTRPQARAAGRRIAAVRDNGGVLVNVFYKHSRIKQYLKDGKAMRIETVVNAPRDLGCNARLPNLDELQARVRAANRRLLDAERRACRKSHPPRWELARTGVARSWLQRLWLIPARWSTRWAMIGCALATGLPRRDERVRRQCTAMGLTFSDDTGVAFERLELVWPAIRT